MKLITLKNALKGTTDKELDTLHTDIKAIQHNYTSMRRSWIQTNKEYLKHIQQDIYALKREIEQLRFVHDGLKGSDIGKLCAITSDRKIVYLHDREKELWLKDYKIIITRLEEQKMELLGTEGSLNNTIENLERWKDE